jgi:hypothetical protein
MAATSGRALVAVAAFALVGCYRGADGGAGEGGATDGDSATGESEGDTSPPVDPFCEDDTLPGKLSRFGRLTHRQYDNAVRDLVGDQSGPSAAFLGDPAIGGFTNNADQLVVSDRLARDYRRAAEAVASSLIADTDRLASLVACEPSDDCARAFIESFGRRAYRRPLTTDEIDRFFAVFQSASGLYETGSEFDQGIALVVEGFLQSPSFLYRVELSAPDGGGEIVKLDDWEMASRLSFMLWNSIPDDELLAAAEAGELGDAANIEMHARRLLADPRATDPIEDFHEQWLKLGKVTDLTKDPDQFPDFDNEVAEAMRDETLRFVTSVILDGPGRYADLLTSTSTFVDADLAAIYGLPAMFGGDLQPAEVDPAKRAGLLTHPGFLAANAYFAETSPIHRGVFVQRQILCTEIPDPPGDADLELPPPDMELRTTRERVESHTSPQYCAGCHTLINEPGYAFEGYDAIGRERTMDNGVEVNTEGSIVIGADMIAFTDAVDMIHQIADSEVAQQCYLTQWFRYASAREEGDEDECTLDGLHEALLESEYDVKELLVALTQTVSFRYRNVEGE